MIIIIFIKKILNPTTLNIFLLCFFFLRWLGFKLQILHIVCVVPTNWTTLMRTFIYIYDNRPQGLYKKFSPKTKRSIKQIHWIQLRNPDYRVQTCDLTSSIMRVQFPNLFMHDQIVICNTLNRRYFLPKRKCILSHSQLLYFFLW